MNKSCAPWGGASHCGGVPRRPSGLRAAAAQGAAPLAQDLLRQNPFHHITRNASQPRIQALELHGQALVIDAQQVQHRRMEIGHGHGVLDRGVA